VTPYLVVAGADRLLDFLKRAFGAVEMDKMTRPDGKIWHACVRIGDSTVMMSEASEAFPAATGAMHLYVSDADAAYRQALALGAESLMEPATQFYGDRSCGVKDPLGNTWWIATHVEDVSAEEMERRKQEFIQRHALGAAT
jgi:uncharacterized glyoxalase superfamily protein PhnB